MESKNIKNILRDVRKLIQEKDYENSLKKCKEALSHEPKNYTFLVFLGFAAQELSKWNVAEDALKQAIEVDAKQLTAWKGLCTLFEKNPTKENQIKLITIYEELLKMQESDASKHKELVDKYAALAQKLRITDKIVEANLLKVEVSNNDSERFSAWKAVALNICNVQGRTDKESLREKAIIESLKCEADEKEKIPLRREMMKIWNNHGLFEEAVEEARHILTSASLDDCEALTIICQIFVKTSAIGQSPIPSDLSEMFELSELLKENAKNADLSLMVQGTVMLARKEPWKAMTLLSQASEKHSLPHFFILLAKTQLECHCYKLAENSAARGLKVAPKEEKKVYGLLCLLLAKSLISQKAKDEAHIALKKSKEKLGDTHQTEICYLDWCLLGDDQEATDKVIDKLNKTALTPDENNEFLYLKAKYEFKTRKNFPEALKIIDSSLELSQISAALHLRAAIFWESEQYEQALQALVQAIKSDPYHPRNYLYLGDYYRAKENESRACQCYLKGHQLDPCDEEIAKRASDSLLKLGDSSTSQGVLLTVTANNSRAQWAWLRLGISYLPSEEAVVPLQRAIRLDPSDSCAWECLGDAYSNQGSFGASLKAFNKVIELNPEAVYPVFRSAMIKKMTGFNEEAIQGFKTVLKLDPSFVAAVEGISDSCLLLAQEYLSQSLFELAKDTCYDAFQWLSEVLLHEQNASCLWKLSGDLHMLLSSLGPKHFPLKSHHRPTYVPDTRDALINSAIRYYGHALAVSPEISWLWQDLGSAYSRLASEDNVLKAAACYHQALTLNPSEAAHWLAFGALITYHTEYFDPNLAQHCYIQALHLDPTSAMSWSGLGFLYLEAGEVHLAHQAFCKAQDTDPDHVNAWIGQAMVANRISPDDVLDLYWHATTLSNHPTGLLGYGYNVCYALQEGVFSSQQEKHRHIINATDCLIRVTGNDESSGTALNTLALLLERQNLLKPAEKLLKKSLEVLPASFKESVKVNLARVFRCQGKGEDALNVLAQISGSGDPDALCEMAMAHWSLSNWEQALKAYQIALQKCEPDMKSHILVAMAMVARKLKQENTVQLLLTSYKHRPVSIAGLLAISAEGFLKNSPQLIDISLMELRKFKFDPDHALNVAHLMSLKEIRKDNLRGAIREMSSAVHQNPFMASLWTRLSRLLIEEEMVNVLSLGRSSLSMTCAQAATKLQQTNQVPSRNGPKSSNPLLSLLIRVAAALVEGKIEQATKSAQAAVHLFPGDAGSWSCLLACLLAKNKWNDSVFQHSLSCEEDPQQLDWLHCMFACYHLINGREEEARIALQKVPDSKSVNCTFLQAVLGSLKDVETFLEKNPRHTMAWRLLVRRLVESGDFRKAEQTIRNWIKVLNSQSKTSILTPLLMMSLVAWEALTSATVKTDQEHWIALGEESINAVLKQTRECAVAFMIAAQFAKSKGNTRFEKKFLKQCLDLCDSQNERMFQKHCTKLTSVVVLGDPFES